MIEAIKIPVPRMDIPDTPEARIKGLKGLSVKKKQEFLPPVGAVFTLGPFVYKVTVTIPNQLRFAATLVDVIIKGVNDGSENVSPIVDPNTGKGIVK